MNVRSTRLGWGGIGALVVLLLVMGASVSGRSRGRGRVPPQEKCADVKSRASALALFAQGQCHAKAVLQGTPAETKCLAKAESKLRTSFAKAEAKATCPGDVEAAVSATAACVRTFGGALSGDARCAAKKLRAAAGKARDETLCARKPAGKRAACLAAVETNFGKAVLKADLKGDCTATAADLDVLVDACVGGLQPPRTCTGGAFPACGGTCPEGLACRPYEVFANGASAETGCSCVDVTNGPQCGGPVCGTDQHCPDPDDVCERWTVGDGCDHMICQPAMVTPTTLPPTSTNERSCDGGEFPSCAGACPDDLRCQSLTAFLHGISFFSGCICVDPRGPRCESTNGCDIDILPFSHCADPSLTCIVTLEGESGDTVVGCSEARCGVSPPTTTSTSNTTSTTSTSSTSSSTTTSTSSSTTTSLPCVSTPGVSGCFRDNGDCTITDTCTGLQWEQKGTIPGPHKVDDRYLWAGCCEDGCETMCQPNAAASATCMAQTVGSTEGCGSQCPTGECYIGRAGAITTIWDWINQLNAQNFAGHDDWRVPQEAGFNPTGARELESILQRPCTRVPCIDPLFGPTASAGYWSATTDAARDLDAWFVDFAGGSYVNLHKREPAHVRAVR